MKKTALLYLLLVLFTCNVLGKEREIKNIILMIPDGASLATFSSARWYQWYNNPEKPHLNIDPYICGMVHTFSSNAPIGDSAPTTSCYMTGVPSLAGFVSTYPVADVEDDIFPMDSAKAYQPLMTVMEAARIVNKMSVGLVFTCEFPHATPADCFSHSYDRGIYTSIAPQMVHNNIDVVIGGGVNHLSPTDKEYLIQKGYSVYTNDLSGFRNDKNTKMWSLFCDNDMPYDLDRDQSKYPSLAEMTRSAIQKLSAGNNGFFLMVEGSKVDWAAHANDPVAMITDLLAFDSACGEAIDFAKKDGETIVIIVPDHGNSGISIGSGRCKNYTTLTKDDLFKNVSQYKITANGLIEKLHETSPEMVKGIFKKNTGIDLSDEELQSILSSEDYAKSSLSNEERMKGTNLSKIVAKILNENTCFGFTTNGHTGEDVLLAVLDPSGKRPTGFIRNTELNQYMASSLNLVEGQLALLTEKYYSKHTDVFQDKIFKYEIKYTKDANKTPYLEVKYKKNKMNIYPNTNRVELNAKPIEMTSVVVYVNKNNTFYIPQEIKEWLTGKQSSISSKK